jgi:DNA-binding LacI/PurR family transcriptional regulator
MAHFLVRSATEQVAEHLRDEIRRGRWVVHLPGSHKLARELGIGKGTIEAALALLEAEGVLVSQGVGRRRRIDLSNIGDLGGLQVKFLPYEDADRKRGFLVELIYKLQADGHGAGFAERSLSEMGMNLKKLAGCVEKTEADAWLVLGGSREVLAWFAARPQPAYALFGRQPSVDIGGTGTYKRRALARAVDRLVALGHRRIVMLTRPERRKPEPGLYEKHFLEMLQKQGITTGAYNLPDWENDPSDFRRCLDGLYAHTPPTALIASEPPLFYAAQQHLALRGMVAPRDVSLLCGDADAMFAWSEPEVSHLRWDSRRLSRNVLRWIRQVARGQDVRRQSLIEAEFVPGGTLGPVPVQDS